MSESTLSTIITMGPVGFEPFDKVGPATRYHFYILVGAKVLDTLLFCFSSYLLIVIVNSMITNKSNHSTFVEYTINNITSLKYKINMKKEMYLAIGITLSSILTFALITTTGTTLLLFENVVAQEGAVNPPEDLDNNTQTDKDKGTTRTSTDFSAINDTISD